MPVFSTLRPALIAVATLLSTALPGHTADDFIARYHVLATQQVQLLVSAGDGIFPTDGTYLPLGAEMSMGRDDAGSVLVLYTDIDCGHCRGALTAMQDKAKADPDFLERNHVVFRLSGSLLDNVIVACLARDSGAMFAGAFDVVQRKKPANWNIHAIEKLMRVAGLEADADLCLETGRLETSYSQFHDLIAVCGRADCRRTEVEIEGAKKPIVLPATPVLFHGHPERDGIAIDSVALGRDIPNFLDGL